ncbi:MAG: hypothetical protein VX874_01725 [Pseudomonadota bacterium]|nr:hypothetical protein [Pseudomonadota bacterium]
MRFNCTEPVQTGSRVLDIARRLGLEFDDYRMTRAPEGGAVIALCLSTPDSAEARVFHARLRELVDLVPETEDA